MIQMNLIQNNKTSNPKQISNPNCYHEIYEMFTNKLAWRGFSPNECYTLNFTDWEMTKNGWKNNKSNDIPDPKSGAKWQKKTIEFEKEGYIDFNKLNSIDNQTGNLSNNEKYCLGIQKANRESNNLYFKHYPNTPYVEMKPIKSTNGEMNEVVIDKTHTLKDSDTTNFNLLVIDDYKSNISSDINVPNFNNSKK